MADHIDKNERFEQGMKTRRSVLGDVHVDRAQTMTSGFDQPFQQLITEAAWGTVWSGNHWTKRERSIHFCRSAASIKSVPTLCSCSNT